MTKMEDPFDQLLDRLEPPVTTIIADVEVLWGVGVGIKRNIPVALFWTMSAKFLSMLHRFNFSDYGDQELDQIEELGEVFEANDPKVMKLALECIEMVPKAHYLLFTSVYELEPKIFNSLQAEFAFPVYPIGPAVLPYLI
ncbi:putative 7-deoxyloganetin glucosyltransferase [Rosa chinensis]|uniref:Putative 7-deoxyloganetin glucosyltransferase n=1 Tax=Rosa chinensis TaxID=74649 RepID=A0A2P6QKF0_ROSCH|nr:putative 7-deoxyloganetin glucosyltransferase [Rosa chinensis]